MKSKAESLPPSPAMPERTTVGLRDIAARTGVSLMTVSLAMRNNPRVAEATKRRVRQVAEELGYRPDPEVARLMSRLRTRSSKRSYASIAIVDLSPRKPGPHNAYVEEIVTGASERARALGYHAFEASVGAMGCGPERLLSILRHRGVTGIVLLPPLSPMVLPPGLDWSDFAVVSTTYAITPDVMNRVVPHQFLDMCRILRRLTAAGFKKIGFAFEREYEERTLYHFTAAITLAGMQDAVLRTPHRSDLTAADVVPWIKQRTPDVILSPFVEQLLPLLDKLTSRKRPLLYSIGRPRARGVPYWEQYPRRIGSYAVNVLVGMIQNSEFGLLESPATTMLHGQFSDAFEPIINPDGKAEVDRPKAWFGRTGVVR